MDELSELLKINKNYIISVIKKSPNELPIIHVSSVADCMDLRNAASETGDKGLIELAYGLTIDSDDGIVYSTSGEIKLDLNLSNINRLISECRISIRDYLTHKKKLNLNLSNIGRMTGESKLRDFSGYNTLNLEEEIGAKRFNDLPEEINGVNLVFKPEEIHGKYLSDKDDACYRFWLALAQGDEKRLETCIKNTASKYNGKPIMRIVLCNNGYEIPDFEAERCLILTNMGNDDYSSVSDFYKP